MTAFRLLGAKAEIFIIVKTDIITAFYCYEKYLTPLRCSFLFGIRKAHGVII